MHGRYDAVSENQPEPSLPPPREVARLRRVLWGLVLLTAVLVVGGAGLFLYQLRQEAMTDARARAAATTRFLEDHMRRLTRATDTILGSVSDLAVRGSLDGLAGDRERWEELRRLRLALPEPGTLWIAAADGEVLMGSVAFPAVPNTVIDRYYFQAQLDGPDRLVVGPMVNTKTRDTQAFHLSRRISGQDGRMRGIVAAGFDAETFTDFYRDLALSHDANIGIVDMDGRIILRQPDPARWAGVKLDDSPLLRMARAGMTAGQSVFASPVDDIERLVAFRVLPDLRLIVYNGLSTEDIYAEWWRAARFTAGACLVVIAALAWLAQVAAHTLAREGRLVTALEDRVRLRTEEAMAQAEEARRANDTKTRFLAAASHDLRQPLQAAGMFVEVLATRLKDTPNAMVVEKLRQSVDATQALLSTLLDASTLEAGKVEPRVGSFPIAPMLAGLADQLEPEATARGLRLKVVSTDAWIVSDPVLLERLLRNLLVNALRYTPAGGVLLGCRPRSGSLAISVVDTGIGIPTDKLGTIFEDFTRLGDKGSGSERGLGLGLSVVRRTADLLRHPVMVRSVEGKGSSFTVVVPLGRTPARD
ncbi:ATP-binding protein [Magnetospirillum sp. UT-4]|uniref:sensor histidine kinase n=1 Tax=Magnetospirillum sp. UT-4 TaxID=2681467 RepID=UPI001381D840|nr:ATP-binding protein [Magnetospirillum sp. UT-4]CAA7614697.1 putative sensor-like histidine kinase [Magnetospirillum sp. UT-4]